MKLNPVLDTDSYKAGHHLQYPPGTQKLFGYLESRGGRYGQTLFFGLQGLIKEYLTQQVTDAHIDEAVTFCKAHGVPFPEAGWRYVAKHLDGKLPLHIRAVPEGTVVPVRNVLMTVESTDPVVPWIVGWLETKLMRLWYPITVATRSWYCKKVLREYLEETSDDPEGELPFKLHDFGGRGGSSRETVAIGGAAHLVNFKGTDTIEGARYAMQYYGGEMPGFSIPAMEHSTVTAWGRDGEEAAFRNMLRVNDGFPIVACVSDSYDIFDAVENLWGDRLLDEVRASGKTVVIRPDSGEPAQVNLRILQILERKVGMRTNGKGYKVLPAYFRLIQGDGNDTEDDLAAVLCTLQNHGYSASNIAFGMGGGLLQKLDRDTQRFAFKLSQIVVDGVARDVRKSPAGDPNKASMAGRLDLVQKEGKFETIVVPSSNRTWFPSELRTVFLDGEEAMTDTFETVRERAARSFR